PSPDRQQHCQIITYGVSKEESARFGLPCGGTLCLLREPLSDLVWLDELLQRCAAHERVVRDVELASGAVTLFPASQHESLQFDGNRLRAPFGPTWRLLLIGAGQLSRYAAELAAGL